MNYYLKASDEATMTQALLDAGVLIETEDGNQVASGFSLDVIGTITKQIGDEEPVAVEGWHANLLGELSGDQATTLAEIILPEPPANPYRVWA